MANFVCHFLVYADDLPRAQAFYSGVFGWRFEGWGPPDFFRILTGPQSDPGVSEGALFRREKPIGEGVNGYRCSVSVVDIEASAAAVVAHGGKMRSDIVDLPGIGQVAEFSDTEGNVVCLTQYVPDYPLAAKA